MARLYITTGPDKGQSFELKGNITSIGRSPDNDIRIEDKSVSRKHAKITRRSDSYFIKDLNSKNGTFIDGQRMRVGDECELREGCGVSLGNVGVYFSTTTSEEESAVTESISIDAPMELSDEAVVLLDSIDLSEEVSEEDLAAMSSPDVSQEISKAAETFLQDRPLTPQKNMELIFKVSSVLMESLHANEDINEILKTILNYILDLLKRIDRGAFILVDEETGEISGLIPMLKKNNGDTMKAYSRTIVDRVIRERKPVIMLDTRREDEADLSESMQVMKIKSVMCVPVISKSKIRGIIYVDTVTKPHGFRKEDLSLLTALSIPAAYALENASFHPKRKTKLK